jgi:hypothetical protein
MKKEVQFEIPSDDVYKTDLIDYQVIVSGYYFIEDAISEKTVFLNAGEIIKVTDLKRIKLC